jgi:hypothetical protein
MLGTIFLGVEMQTEVAEPRLLVFLPEEGMETDRMVAEFIFGWSMDETPINVFYDPWAALWRPRPNEGRVATPSWSRVPSDAIKVIERMEELGFDTQITRQGGMWHMTISAQERYSAVHYPNFCYAVCIAALGALGVIR